MASTALPGDRRWASGRRGGMTVLGKVTVPKPINLPRQRLENHGLDPNVEIVPEGTLSWGSRTSATSNAWGSCTLSLKTNGGMLSLSNLCARPSSGENGTRPSTADSVIVTGLMSPPLMLGAQALVLLQLSVCTHPVKRRLYFCDLAVPKQGLGVPNCLNLLSL